MSFSEPRQFTDEDYERSAQEYSRALGERFRHAETIASQAEKIRRLEWEIGRLVAATKWLIGRQAKVTQRLDIAARAKQENDPQALLELVDELNQNE